MHIDWNHFTPLSALSGGVLIGLAAAMFVLFNGRIAGISGIIGGVFRPKAGDLAWRVVGADSIAWDGPGLGEPGPVAPGAQWAADSLYTLSLAIAGGTNEIQRSIIAERVLGLPREPVNPATR